MMGYVVVKFTGSLRRYAPDGTDAPFHFEWSEARPIEELLETMGVPMTMVQVVMVNHRAVPQCTVAAPGDRVCVFPVEYAFFADWLHLRFNR
jgi:sulfur carrier protein ThiS